MTKEKKSSPPARDLDEPVDALWSGRLSGGVHPAVQRFTRSIQFDKRLARWDIQGTAAHVRMLARQNIISDQDAETILGGLTQVRAEIERGIFPFRDELEDIHMNIEHRLIEVIGEVGAKVHAGRSRNDQVALDVALYCLDVSKRWRISFVEVIAQLVVRAEELKLELFPGWTHMQSAQPVSWGHYLLSFAEMFGRDYRRLELFEEMNSTSPLGAGALGGSSLDLDPESTAAELGFRDSFANSYDVVGNRDTVLELMQIATQLMIHLSRLAEDFVYLSSTPVGWLELPDSLCTGSSMMPQKKNPDLLELMRGRTASVIGHGNAVSVLLKGLPTSYHRDLQQDKEHLFAVVDIVSDALEVLIPLLEGFSVNQERVAENIEGGYLMATDLAEHLVEKGVPFREAHRQVGRLVGYCVDNSISLSEVSLEKLREFLPDSEIEPAQFLVPRKALERRKHKGSTGFSSIESQLGTWRRWLGTKSGS
ncbi:MAG TPA: argininosuccinate lyase [Acidobacteriota bacterium]|nr:argininosuccinate lyase [Acidobacteriota bacterium]